MDGNACCSGHSFVVAMVIGGSKYGICISHGAEANRSNLLFEKLTVTAVCLCGELRQQPCILAMKI